MCNRLGLSHVVLCNNGCSQDLRKFAPVRVEGRRDQILDAPYYELEGWTYFRVNVRPEIVFFSLGASDASAARFKT